MKSEIYFKKAAGYEFNRQILSKYLEYVPLTKYNLDKHHSPLRLNKGVSLKELETLNSEGVPMVS